MDDPLQSCSPLPDDSKSHSRISEIQNPEKAYRKVSEDLVTHSKLHPLRENQIHMSSYDSSNISHLRQLIQSTDLGNDSKKSSSRLVDQSPIDSLSKLLKLSSMDLKIGKSNSRQVKNPIGSSSEFEAETVSGLGMVMGSSEGIGGGTFCIQDRSSGNTGNLEGDSAKMLKQFDENYQQIKNDFSWVRVSINNQLKNSILESA